MDKYTKRTALKLTLLSQLLLDELEELKGTNLYKQSFKNLISKLERELEATCKHNFENIYNEDTGKHLNLLNEIVEELVHKSLDFEVKHKTPYFLYCDKVTGRKVLSSLEPEAFFKEAHSINA